MQYSFEEINMKKLLILLFSILISFNALSSYELKYKNYIKNPSIYSDYLKGLEAGMSMYRVGGDYEEPFYCQPKALGLGLDNIQNIIDSQVEQMIDLGFTQAHLDDEFVGLILLYGLRSTFPCN